MSPLNLIIDTDNGLGGPLNLFPPKGNLFDVDDGLAIVLAIKSRKITVQGITTVFGVSNPKDSFRVTSNLLKILKRDDIPVIEGARSEKDFGKKNHATDFIINQILKSDNEISLCTLGPLTNIATAFKLEPRILKRIRKVAIMGSILPINNIISRFFPTEFNFNLDITSAEYVLKRLQEEGIPTIISDMNLCLQVTFSDKQIGILKGVNNELANFILNGVKDFYYFNKGINPLKRGFTPWDPICIASLIDKSLFSTKFFWTALKKIRIGGLFKLGGLIDILRKKPKEFKTPIEFCTSIDAERFLKMLLSALIGNKV
ncbi:MAG: hypothetical protein GF329_18600 [Candidatus Lokiarchaeota archaeon]|nr:hypothetical protein [Candidatus Lokiarchaeota archaeon]